VIVKGLFSLFSLFLWQYERFHIFLLAA